MPRTERLAGKVAFITGGAGSIGLATAREFLAGVFNDMIPLGRDATLEEIARAVLFLASNDKAFLTGATIPVDGAMSA